jgi:hypothetical protein
VLDHAGHAINDPYPSPFPSCGFDLDAVGVIHEAFESVSNLPSNCNLLIYPNPSNDFITIDQKVSANLLAGADLATITGNVLFQLAITQSTTNISLAGIPPVFIT